MEITVIKRAFYQGSLVEPGKVISNFPDLEKGQSLPSWAVANDVVSKPEKAETKAEAKARAAAEAAAKAAEASTTQKQTGDGKSDNLPHGAGDIA